MRFSQESYVLRSRTNLGSSQNRHVSLAQPEMEDLLELTANRLALHYLASNSTSFAGFGEHHASHALGWLA